MTKKRWCSAALLMQLILISVLFATTNARCDAVKYIYDSAGRLFRVIDDEGRTATYRYDEVGNILAVERGEGQANPSENLTISPDSAASGTTVEIVISGNNLAGSYVTVDSPGSLLTKVRTSDTEVLANLSISPQQPLGPMTMRVENSFGSSVVILTIKLPPAVIAGVTPDSGPPTRLVAITGSGYSVAATEDIVTFNGVAAPVYSASPGRILTAVPSGAASGPVIVAVNGQVPSNPVNFTVTDPGGLPPAIASIFPNKGPAGGGMRAVVNGSALGSVTSVRFGAGSAFMRQRPSDSAIDVMIPPGTPGNCDVTASGASGDFLLQGGFTYIDAPVLNVVSTNPPEYTPWPVPLNILPAVAFDRAVNPSTVNSGSFTLIETASGSPVDATLSLALDNTVVTCAPTAGLKPDTAYSIALTQAIESAQGSPLSFPLTYSFTTASSGDSSPASVSVYPLDGRTGVPRNSTVAFIFSKPINRATIGDLTVTVTDNGIPVFGKITFGSRDTSLCFTPFSAFLPSSVVTVTLSGKVTDETGSAIIGSGGPGTDFVSSFTTAATSAMEPLRVLTVDPPPRADNVSPDATVSLTFNAPVNPTTVTYDSLYLYIDSFPGDMRCYGPLSLSPDLTVLTMTPGCLSTGHTYFVSFRANLRDLAGNGMAWQAPTWFHVPWNPEFFVQAYSLSLGGENVPLNTRIGLAFSEAVDPSSLDQSSFHLTGWSGALPGTFTTSQDGMKAWFQPLQALEPHSSYSFDYTSGIKNVRGLSLQVPASSSFTTGEESDVGPPEVLSIVPSNGAERVPVNGKIMIRFSHVLDAITLGPDAITLSKYGQPVPTSIYATGDDGKTFMVHPANNEPLEANSFYNLTVSTAIADRAGNHLAADFQSAFTTGDIPDTNPPEVVSVNPPDGSTGIPAPGAIEAVFSEPLDPGTVNAGNFGVNQNTSTYLAFNEGSNALAAFEGLHAGIAANPGVEGSYQVSLDGKKATFIPTIPLFAGRNYSILLGSIADLSGNHHSFMVYGFSTALAEGTNTEALPTSGSIQAEPRTLAADGTSSATVVVSGLVDKNGAQVPDGTRIAVYVCFSDRQNKPAGSVQGGESSCYPGFKIFPAVGGEVSFTYQAPALSYLHSGQEASAVVKLYSLDAADKLTAAINMSGDNAITLSGQ